MKDPIKVYDARWEIDEFSDAEIKRLFEATFGYAQLLNVNTLILTRDVRLGCPRLMEIGIETAITSGFRVMACFDPISTPLSYYTILKTSVTYPQTMGLTITASHNPMQYVGIKFTVPTMQAIGYDSGPLGGLTKIRELYHSNFILGKKPGGELHIIPHPAEEYIKYSLKTANVEPGDLSGMNLVLDTLNGSAGPELYATLTTAGARVIPLRIVPNGYFPTGSPNPTSQKKLDLAIQTAKELKADLVIGVDGDGDRIVFGDQKGIFSASFVMIPILQTLLSKQKFSESPRILYDPKTNPLALKKWVELQVQPVLFRNGHSQIKGYMRQIDALAGAEESGHYYHKLQLENIQMVGENSLVTILLLLNTLKKQPQLLQDIRNMQDRVFTSGEFNYQFVSDELRDQAMAAVIQYFESDGAALTTETSDGIDLQGTVVNKGVHFEKGKVILDEKWYSGYIRMATNEKNVVRSYISSGDKLSGKTIENVTRKILQEKFQGKVID